jgi:hypothetical protein
LIREIQGKFATPAAYHGWLVNGSSLFNCSGRAIAQAVSRRLPTAAARVRAQVRSCAIYGGQKHNRSGMVAVLGPFEALPCYIHTYGGQSDTGPGSLRVLRLHHIHHPSSGAGTIGQLVADVQSGLSVTTPQETETKTQLH